MSTLQNRALLAHPARFVAAFPELQVAHRATQCGFFGAAGKAGLDTSPRSRQARLDGINALLGLGIHSTTQLSPETNEALISAIEAGAFNKDWTLSGLVRADVHINLAGTPLCSCCAERPVRYRFAEVENTDQGFCCECLPPQAPSEDEVSPEQVAADKAAFGIEATSQDEFERLLEIEEAREVALTGLQARANRLRREMVSLKNSLSNAHVQSAGTGAGRRVLREMYFSKRNELLKLEREYPFI